MNIIFIIPLVLTAVVVLAIIIAIVKLVKNQQKSVPMTQAIKNMVFGKGPKDLLKTLEMEDYELEMINIHYRKHDIPKKTGGSRTLHIPAKNLKKAQRKILKQILSQEKTHSCSYAYRKGKSIVDNARVHCNSTVLIKMDIRDFFPSVSSEKVNKVFANAGWNKEGAEKLTELCSWKNGLPQGAPTSPALSNIILKDLDHKLFAMARGFKAKYSRYADDLTFSLEEDNPEHVRAIIKFTQLAVEKEGFRINFKKGKINVLRNHQRQKVCGITVNSEKPTLSRKERRKLRAIRHHIDNKRPATMNENQLKGWENFQKMVHRSN